jgi:cell shape-determining protein MreC
MSYLLDKKIKRNTLLKNSILVILLIIIIYFRVPFFNGLSYASSIIFRPVVIVGNIIGEKLSSIGSYFYSKKLLLSQNEELRLKLNEQEARISNYNSIFDENIKIKEILERKNSKLDTVLAGILSKPNQSPYDTLVIDVGIKNGISVGQRVFARGNVPIGRVALVYANSAKVVLFSSPGEKTEVVISGKDAFMQVIGRGGGNFEIIIPRDFILEKGTEVVLPGITTYIVGVVQTIISDPRDAFQKALLTSPVNIQELKFVEVEK